MKNPNDILGYNDILFACYFDEKFVCYEKWGDSGWKYSEDKKTWDYEQKYAITKKILLSPKHY